MSHTYVRRPSSRHSALLTYHHEVVNENHRQDVGDESWIHRVKESRGCDHGFAGGCERLTLGDCSCRLRYI